MKSNITSTITGTLTGHWTYNTPFGYKTKSWSQQLTLQPDVEQTVNINIPTGQPLILVFTFDSFTFTYDIDNAWHDCSWSGTTTHSFNLGLPENEILVHYEEVECAHDIDCLSPCEGILTWCGTDNQCHAQGECIKKPEVPGVDPWQFIASVWDSFMTWILSWLGW